MTSQGNWELLKQDTAIWITWYEQAEGKAAIPVGTRGLCRRPGSDEGDVREYVAGMVSTEELMLTLQPTANKILPQIQLRQTRSLLK